jgi:protein-S-isoprenylcysteine O-methyltransferase Ste14
MTRHPRLTRGALIVLALILCACIWSLVALVLLRSVQPASQIPL